VLSEDARENNSLENFSGFNTDRKARKISNKRSRPRKLEPDEEATTDKQLFLTRIHSYELNSLMTIEVVKRGLKVFIRAHNSKLRYSSEVELHLKQACSYLMYFGNDFDRFIRDALIFHSGGKISLIDMNKLRYLAAV
jgi:hypothetical protein